MKLITAIIKPFMVDRLSRALLKAPVTGFTVSDARGYGQGAEQSDYLSPRMRFEIAVLTEHVEQVTELIIKSVSTHMEDDGILYVTELQSVYNLRTGMRDREALTN
jgi:nitrogen regulatory protein P-II 1